ncbi:hypothetical protein J2741_000926 [Methanolinea mesophila]|uniref:hypothetical protein n=1 Tax=Methanolinea mesophila TaxID=547055 RepID=UPI001AE9F350|nr:hypothetical protein [Methanolinea mesophila]MBP1928379.1 hypothetical protein [Methanolinea mesophila]
MKSFTLALLTIVTLAVVTGGVFADTGIFQTPETQGFSTGTTIQALGTVTETDGLTWIISSDTIPPEDLLFIYYTTSYSEDTIADQGLVSYVKTASIDTAEQAVGVDNVATSKVVEFIGLDTGRMTSSENVVLDGASSGFEGEENFICPFAATVDSFIPAFCNIEEMGSDMDLTLGSLTTTTGEHFLGYAADPGVSMDYSVKLTGFGDVPAMGSADAYINVHVQEAREGPVIDDIGAAKAEDLTYSEFTTASGDITLFQKVMGYDSKVSGPLPTFDLPE